MDKNGDQVTRRRMLQTLVLVLGGIATLPVASRLFGRSSRATGAASDLPGEGSIFQPRRDAQLEEWERKRRSSLG